MGTKIVALYGLQHEKRNLSQPKICDGKTCIYDFIHFHMQPELHL